MSAPAGEIDARLLGTVLVSCACGALLGYYAGVARSLFPSVSRGRPGLAIGVPATRPARPNGRSAPLSDDGSGSDSDESITEGGADEDLTKVTDGPTDACKLVLVVRTDLGMTSGKIAAQCSHATLSCFKAVSKANRALLRAWEREGQAKIALQCKSEDDMLLLQVRWHPREGCKAESIEAQAQSLGLCARVVQDAGRTQIAAGSRTVLGIGPAPVKEIDKVTKHLRLL